MKIAGLQKVTLLDYPGKVASTIFLAGCNMKCLFCQNVDLVYNSDKINRIELDEIINFFKNRVGKIEGVCITGGEPLLNNDISELLHPLKELKFNIKIDTNGTNPSLLKKIIDENLVDMVAMDIKSSKKKYLKIIGLENEKLDVENFFININESINILKTSNIDYEFRTTCVKGLHTIEDMEDIGLMIKGAKKYFLQNYRSNEQISNLPYKSFEKTELESFINILKKYIDNVYLRGID